MILNINLVRFLFSLSLHCLYATHMKPLHKVIIHNRKIGRTITFEVPEGEYILRSFESHGEQLPFSCRNGCCSACAVRVLSGQLDQTDGIGLSQEMQSRGYALLSISKALTPLELETQEEDEVYEKQYGKYLGKIKGQLGNPLDI